MGRMRLELCAGLLLLAMALVVPSVWGQQRPIVQDLIITHTDQEVLLYSTLKEVFSHSFLEVIQSGLPTTVTFHMRLYRKRGMWLDE